MNLQQFKDKYLGKSVEFHSFGTGAQNQCTDLVNQYINEVLDNHTKDYTEIIGANAKDFNTKYDPEDFEWIANTPLGVPQAGDIIIWNGKVGGGAGHVAIFLEGDINSFKSLDQNWSQTEKVTLETHNYTNVSGWLRPRNKQQEDQQAIINQLINERDRNWNWFSGLCEIMNEQVDYDVASVTLEGLMTYKDQVIEKDKQIGSLNDGVTKLTQEVNTLKEDNTTLLNDNKKMETEIKEAREEGEIQKLKLNDVTEKLEQLGIQCKQEVLTGFKKWLYNLFIR